ncbi:MAG: hypothetical protein M3Q48_15535 [Actinomycetota bacterium]|nr:hypothetical protein [Actinomycetota bacterium]
MWRDSPPPVSGGPAPAGGLLVVIVIATVSAACSGSEDETALLPEGRTSGCEAAFEEAESQSSTPRLQLTLVACDAIGDWVAEAASPPELVRTDDEIRFAASMCATAVALDVRESKTCRQALARYPEFRGDAPPS